MESIRITHATFHELAAVADEHDVDLDALADCVIGAWMRGEVFFINTNLPKGKASKRTGGSIHENDHSEDR